MSETQNKLEAIVKYADKCNSISCPYGDVKRIVTGGEGGVANVHIVKVSQGSAHFHAKYNEVYYVLSGHGKIDLERDVRDLYPGAVVVIPAGVVHSLEAEEGDMLEFILFGTPAMSIDHEDAKPLKPKE